MAEHQRNQINELATGPDKYGPLEQTGRTRIRISADFTNDARAVLMRTGNFSVKGNVFAVNNEHMNALNEAGIRYEVLPNV